MPDVSRVQGEHNQGFTLAELLIVVAIVAVLVAIAVPVFTGSLSSAEEAVCADNRHSLKVLVSDAYLLDNTADPQELFNHFVAELDEENGDDDLCPAGGTLGLTVVDEQFIITCSKHGMSTEDQMISNILSGFEGKSGLFFDSQGNKIGSTDSDLRQAYAKANNLTTWPELTATDGKACYLQFKTYGKDLEKNLFLYAGYNSDPYSTSDVWRTRYVCDNTGIIDPANPGQWYELSKDIRVSDNDPEKLAATINSANPQKVTLSNGTFIKA